MAREEVTTKNRGRACDLETPSPAGDFPESLTACGY